MRPVVRDAAALMTISLCIRYDLSNAIILKSQKKARPRMRVWLRRLTLAFSMLIALSFVLVMPLRWLNPTTSSFMLQDDSGRNPLLFEWTDWQSMGIAPALAVVAAEDQKFATHFGFDVESIRESLDDAEKGGRLRGASTISQQVSKNLFLWPGQNFFRKGLEAYMTVIVEICLPKRRILEIYLNIAELGPGIYGVPAASRYFFGKPPSQMTNAEAALLAAVLPNPIRLKVNDPSAYVRERQRWILGQMTRLRREHWIVGQLSRRNQEPGD